MRRRHKRHRSVIHTAARIHMSNRPSRGSQVASPARRGGGRGVRRSAEVHRTLAPQLGVLERRCRRVQLLLELVGGRLQPLVLALPDREGLLQPRDLLLELDVEQDGVAPRVVHLGHVPERLGDRRDAAHLPRVAHHLRAAHVARARRAEHEPHPRGVARIVRQLEAFHEAPGRVPRQRRHRGEKRVVEARRVGDVAGELGDDGGDERRALGGPHLVRFVEEARAAVLVAQLHDAEGVRVGPRLHQREHELAARARRRPLVLHAAELLFRVGVCHVDRDARREDVTLDPRGCRQPQRPRAVEPLADGAREHEVLGLGVVHEACAPVGVCHVHQRVEQDVQRPRRVRRDGPSGRPRRGGLRLRVARGRPVGLLTVARALALQPPVARDRPAPALPGVREVAVDGAPHHLERGAQLVGPRGEVVGADAVHAEAIKVVRELLQVPEVGLEQRPRHVGLQLGRRCVDVALGGHERQGTPRPAPLRPQRRGLRRHLRGQHPAR
mmetsp:Transcript_47405/g.146252  ORF Transcript_47405/g.146252 Transcript_47405/m.146252 type:complete len:498 (-) Transcript_47405:30-1523(-)